MKAGLFMASAEQAPQLERRLREARPTSRKTAAGGNSWRGEIGGRLRLGRQPAEQAAVDRVAVAVVEAHEQVAGLEIRAARGEILREEIHAPEFPGVGLVVARNDHEAVRVEGVMHGFREHGVELVEGSRRMVRRMRGHVGEHLAVGVEGKILEGQGPGVFDVLRHQLGGHRDHLPVADDVARLREPAARILRAGAGSGQQKKSGAAKRQEAEGGVHGAANYFRSWRISIRLRQKGPDGMGGDIGQRSAF